MTHIPEQPQPPAYEQVLADAKAHLDLALVEFRRDWTPGTGPASDAQFTAFARARMYVEQALAALDWAAP